MTLVVPDLSGLQRLHMVGAGGAGMSALAKLLAQLGHQVTGSDLKPGRMLEALDDLGVETWIGHRPDRIRDLDAVVASSAVPDRDPELQAATAAGIPVLRRPELLASLTREMPAIGVSGTHGKTTTTALLVTGLRSAGLDPSYIVGGELVSTASGAHLGDRDIFVVEADEAFGTFTSLRMRALLVTNIDADHLDHYGTVGGVEAAFASVAGGVEGPVVVCADDPRARRIPSATITYGTDRSADWRILDVEDRAWRVAFRLAPPAGDPFTVEVAKPGLHVARNAAGAVALAAALGADPERAAAGLAGFAGVRRRFDIRARLNGITVVDDYAHHPTEVAATVAAARRTGASRVWTVFQPHRYSRTAEVGAAFGPALAGADRVVVTDVYAAGEPPEPGVTGKLVADAAIAAGAAVDYVANLREVPDLLVPELRPGDLVLLLGAGDVTMLADVLVERIGSGR